MKTIDQPTEAKQSIADATGAFRDHVLAQEWRSSAQVANLLGEELVTNSQQFGNRLRRAHRLWGIWNGSEFQYPAWQFTRTGLDSHFVRLLAVLSAPDFDRDGWLRASWLYTGKSMLEDATPAATWATDPDAVIAAAEAEFGCRARTG